MNRTVIVTGIPGTGKTTVCNLVVKLAKEADVNVNVLNYGTVTMEILQRYGKAMERDAMRKADIDSQRKLQKEVAETLSERIRGLDGITIVDTHMAIKTPCGYMPGMPQHVMQFLKPELFVLIEAKPSEISLRRTKDISRKRDTTMEEAVTEELLFSRLMAGACSVLTGAPVKIAVNAEGKPEEAAKEILKALGVTMKCPQ
jgi:adenylate kinase